MAFLPVTYAEMRERGWSAPDIVVVTGDAYVDHPSFGIAIVSRVLEANGFRVCILAQPQSKKDFTRFGKPTLAFFVSSGNIDSMVARYTVAKKKRTEDAYSPGGKNGFRPDRAAIVYTKRIREIYPDVPIALGGLEASLRRFAHYDYWDDAVRPSILPDAGADLLMYGMGEKQVVEIARRLHNGDHISTLTDIRGVMYTVPKEDFSPKKDYIRCPSYEEVKAPTREGKKQYAISCRIEQEEHDAVRGKTLYQETGDLVVVQNPPMPPLSTEELDAVYELPYERNYHPTYEAMGGVPAISEVKFSITHVRGCYGACNFCSLAYHQGRQITCRSHESVLKEAEMLTHFPDFKGYIHDVGGPTANFRAPSCRVQEKHGLCPQKKCLAPKPCKNLEVSHADYLSLLKKLQKIPKIKKVFIRSGIRFDYLMLDKDESFFKELVKNHISGQLKVAPEHCSENVLRLMGKPSFKVYQGFQKRFYELTKSANMKQYLVPYLMSSHPGSTVHDAIALSLYLRSEKLHPQQVQDFYPTPGTVSTCMYYTGLDPFTLAPVFIPKDPKEKAEQRALLQYFRPENRALVISALTRAGREDLIGYGKECLITPDAGQKNSPSAGKSTQKRKGSSPKKNPTQKPTRKQKKR